MLQNVLSCVIHCTLLVPVYHIYSDCGGGGGVREGSGVV